MKKLLFLFGALLFLTLGATYAGNLADESPPGIVPTEVKPLLQVELIAVVVPCQASVADLPAAHYFYDCHATWQAQPVTIDILSCSSGGIAYICRQPVYYSNQNVTASNSNCHQEVNYPIKTHDEWVLTSSYLYTLSAALYIRAPVV